MRVCGPRDWNLERNEDAIVAASGFLEAEVEYRHCCVVFVIFFQRSVVLDEGRCVMNMSSSSIVCMPLSKVSRDL